MEALLKRAEQIAAAREQARLRQVAQELKKILGEAAVQIEGSRLLISGRGIMKRWLVDPALRFLAGTFK
jgi:GAF domain-containing protein